MATRDIVVIGASLGGIEALTRLAGQLPVELPASVFIVQHTASDSPGGLSDILSRAGALPAVTARDGMAIERGRIYVAPPGRHMLLTAAGVRVAFGPRENRARPAVDPLFRTAAVNYRSRVVGVVLTGLLDDGAAGLVAIERCGGVCVVQSPADAAYPEMPMRALASADVDHTVPLAEMGALLSEVCAQAAPEPPEVPVELRMEARLTEGAMETEDWSELPGTASTFTCPECGGPVRRVADDDLRRYRCEVGHAFSAEALLDAQDHATEQALWAALQTLQERARMLDAMAREDLEHGRRRSASSYEERAQETRVHAERLRQLLGLGAA